MICLDTSFAQFFTLEFWNKLANIIMAIIAFGALWYTKRQLRSNREESRRATAYATYQEYLNLCFNNASLAYGNEEQIAKNEITKISYPWFISQMLFTFEQILENQKKDKQWETAITHQLKQHAWFLKKSNSAARDEWCYELKSLITIVVKDYEKLNSHTVKPPSGTVKKPKPLY